MSVMKHRQSYLLKLYAAIVGIIFAGIVVTAPISVGLGTLWPHAALVIKSWKEILMGITLVLAVIAVTRHQLWGQLWHDWILRLIAGYALLHMVLLGYHYQGAKAASAGILIDLRYLLFFVLVYVLMKLAPWYRLRLLIVSAFGAMVVVVFGALQLFLPRDILSHIGYSSHTIEPYLTVDKNPNYVRINSTLRGPNPLGAYVTIVLALMVSIVGRQAKRFKNSSRTIGFGLIALAAIVTLWISYSRSALVAAILAIAIVIAIVWARVIKRHAWWLLGIGAMLLVLAVALGSRGSFVDNVLLHDNPGTGAAVTSDQAHASSLRDGFSTMIHQPLGSGIGSTGSASLLGYKGTIVEDQYLFVAHESGWIGLVLFGIISGFVLVRLYNDRRDWLSLGLFASGIGLAFIEILLPVWADDTVSIVWWGLAGIALGAPQIVRARRK